MEMITSVWSDVGIRKNTNQDSALIEIADTDHDKVALAVICDGMGGPVSYTHLTLPTTPYV